MSWSTSERYNSTLPPECGRSADFAKKSLSENPTSQGLGRAFDFNDDPLSSGAGASEGIMSGSEGASDPSVARVGAFSDGVFAFAITATLTAVAFLSPPLAVAGYLTTGVVYILPVPALIGLKQRRYRVRSGRGI